MTHETKRDKRDAKSTPSGDSASEATTVPPPKGAEVTHRRIVHGRVLCGRSTLPTRQFWLNVYFKAYRGTDRAADTGFRVLIGSYREDGRNHEPPEGDGRAFTPLTSVEPGTLPTVDEILVSVAQAKRASTAGSDFETALEHLRRRCITATRADRLGPPLDRSPTRARRSDGPLYSPSSPFHSDYDSIGPSSPQLHIQSGPKLLSGPGDQPSRGTVRDRTDARSIRRNAREHERATPATSFPKTVRFGGETKEVSAGPADHAGASDSVVGSDDSTLPTSRPGTAVAAELAARDAHRRNIDASAVLTEFTSWTPHSAEYPKPLSFSEWAVKFHENKSQDVTAIAACTGRDSNTPNTDADECPPLDDGDAVFPADVDQPLFVGLPGDDTAVSVCVVPPTAEEKLLASRDPTDPVYGSEKHTKLSGFPATYSEFMATRFEQIHDYLVACVRFDPLRVSQLSSDITAVQARARLRFSASDPLACDWLSCAYCLRLRRCPACSYGIHTGGKPFVDKCIDCVWLSNHVSISDTVGRSARSAMRQVRGIVQRSLHSFATWMNTPSGYLVETNGVRRSEPPPHLPTLGAADVAAPKR